MIVKFFNRGKGGGNGPVDYLLGKDRDRDGATLNQGNSDSVINLINSCHFTQKYKSGCLSFEEEDLPQAHKNKLMSDFEKALLPGLDKNQYSILWVEHKDKNRLELNFVIPCVELTTGKRLQPYYDRVDRLRIDTWKRCVNTSLNLHDPDAPQNKRPAMDLKVTGLPKNKKEQIEHISNALLNHIESGLIKRNSDIVRTLKDAGFTITRKSKNTISIKDPNGGKNIKLKGEIYEESFEFSGNHAERVATAQANYEAAKPREFERNKTELARLCNAKSERNKGLYKVSKAEPESNDCELQVIIEQARERGAATHRLTDKLSNIENIEIQRCNTLNIVSVRGRDGRSVLLDGAEHNGGLPENKRTRESLEINRNENSGSGEGRDILLTSPRGSSIKSIHVRERPSSMGVEIDDRTRESIIESITGIINKSRNNVSRVQKYFGEISQSVVNATEVLRGFTTRKSNSDSVSQGLDNASGELNRTAKRVIVKLVENNKKSDLEQDHETYWEPSF